MAFFTNASGIEISDSVLCDVRDIYVNVIGSGSSGPRQRGIPATVLGHTDLQSESASHQESVDQGTTPLIPQPIRGIQAPILPPRVLRSIQQDASLNKLSGDLGQLLITLPVFTMQLSDSPDIIIQLGYEAGPAASCAFNLAGRLGLFHGQPNESRGEFETVALSDLIHNGITYCARISRHYLVLLISEHVQHVWQDGIRTHASTNIGHFTIWENEGHFMVHFDGSFHSSTVAVIPHQILADIQEAARGGYRIEINGALVWLRCTPLEFAMLIRTPAPPSAVIYMLKEDIDKWRLIKDFAIGLERTIRVTMEEVRTPAVFIAARERNWLAPTNSNQARTAFERLARSIQLLALARRGYLDRPEALAVGIPAVAYVCNEAMEILQLFRSAEIDRDEFCYCTRERFIELFELYQHGHVSSLGKQLEGLLETRQENLAHVLSLGGLALLARLNAEAILVRAREVPQEWICLVSAPDSDMFIGAT